MARQDLNKMLTRIQAVGTGPEPGAGDQPATSPEAEAAKAPEAAGSGPESPELTLQGHQPAPAPAATAAPTPTPAPMVPGGETAQTAPGRARSTRAKTPTTTAVEPTYRNYEAKTARLRMDQLQNLTAVQRRLTAAKAGAGERITDNTLIRIAVDLLLERADKLAGTTEAELRKSVGL